MANQTILRISREVTQIQQGSDLSIAVACQESDVRHVKALIIGPPETPYEYGFFEFSVKFGTEYPSKPPKVDAKTTNGGRCRFNPNIYAQGKVCLSILGTWNGEKPGEEWSSAQGLESILISIQSLMSNNPYENEPGFENARSASDEKNQCSYREKIRHETLRIAVIQMLEEALGIQPDGTIEPPTPAWDPEADAEVEEELAQMADAEKPRFEPFKDLYKRRLLWYYDTYLQTIDTYAQKNKDGERFEKMPFEGGSNSMDGVFQYTDLRRRLSFIKDVIYAETNKWAEEGMIAKQRELSVAANLQRQFEQLVEHHRIKNMVTLNLELVNGNPFVWQITYFGRPMTHLDGGVLRIRVCLSPRFPDEQPRVRIETPIYHHRVSKDGIVCYFPKKLDEGSMKGHVEAIIDALEDESPPFDPRTIVNPEATKLFWGSAEDKKRYNRMLRGSVQKTDDPSGVGRAPD